MTPDSRAADEAFMAEALDAAAAADFATSPNPMVGAVVVREGRVLARGFHRRAGEAHAEVEALRAAGEAAHGATLYTTLEPCAHQGRTPPCVEAVIAAGVGRCVVAMTDPDPRTDGRGLAALREAGIAVEVGVLDSRARRLNEFWLTAVTARRPFVTAKFAMSLDGRIATHSGESKWITSEEARARVHQLRHAHDAVLVGANTVVRDDPNLTTRLPGGRGRQPLRIVLDSRLRVPTTARIFARHEEIGAAGGRDGGVLVATSDRARSDRLHALEEAGVQVVVFPAAEGKVSIADLLRHLAGDERISLLIEGGSAVHGSAFDAGLVDKVAAFIAPRVIGGVESPSAVGGHGVDLLEHAALLDEVAVEQLGPDLFVSGYCTRR